MNRFKFMLGCGFYFFFIVSCTGKQQQQSQPIISQNYDSLAALTVPIEGYLLNAMGVACSEGNIEKVSELSGRGISIEGCMTDEIYEYDALYTAVYFQQKELLEHLIQDSCDINRMYDENGTTLLFLACRLGNFPIVQQLLFAGAYPDGTETPNEYFTAYPYLEALEHDEPDIINMLVLCGADTTVVKD